MLRIVFLSLLLTVVIGCYPPSYYDYWNKGSVERYLDSYDYYDYGYPYDYPGAYNPYYYPYLYLPFFFSFSYSYDSHHYDHDHHHRRSPYDGRHYRGWWRK